MSVKQRLIDFSDWFTPTRLSKIFVVAVVLNMFFTAMLLVNVSATQKQTRSTSRGNGVILENVQDLLGTVKHYTSPEQQAKNDKKLNEFANTVILTINCDNQENNQKVIDLFVEKGVLSLEDANLLDQECKQQTTTTTTPGG